MFALVVTLHVIVCLILIFFVLLQGGRGAELGAAFGSVGQVGYARGQMSGIAKLTSASAAIFMITSLTLAYLSSERANESVVKDLPPSVTKEAKEESPSAATTTATPDQKTTTEGATQNSQPIEASPVQLEQTEAPPLPNTAPITPTKASASQGVP